MYCLFILGLLFAGLFICGTYTEVIVSHQLPDSLVSSDLKTQIDGSITFEELGKMFNALLGYIEEGKHDLKACQDCNTSLTYGKMLINDPGLIHMVAEDMCKSVNYSKRVCEGTLSLISAPMAQLFQYTKLSAPEMCATLMSPDCMTLLGLPFTKFINWELALPKRQPFIPINSNDKQLKMLHMTDIHLDLWYTPGSNSSCGEPLCCRSTSPGDSQRAGYWSQTKYFCDCPTNFMNDAIEQIGHNHQDIDFTIWTGDNIPHDVWNTTQQVNLEHIATVTKAVKLAFPTKPVMPCLGNHETHPIDWYVPNELSIKTNGSVSMGWLYDNLADDLWKQWIDTPSAQTTFKKGGFYSKQFTKQIKVIVMNNNVCQHQNYWIAYDPIDPDGQLQWLIDELQQAETDGTYAMIIGHIPPSECYTAWGNNYFRILERYAHLIVSTYYGHTHNDEIIVLYNKYHETNGTYAISHGYIGASLTTYTLLNPGYKIFTLDSNGRVLDFNAFYTNVTKDNIEGRNISPKWQTNKSAKTLYAMDSLSTQSWDQFMTRAETDDELVEKYIKHYHRFSDDYVTEKTKSGDYNIKTLRNLLLSKRTVNPIYNILPNKY